MATASVTSKGQITIPKAVREHLKIRRGDRIEFLIDPNGRVTIWPITADVRQLKGIVPKPSRPVAVEEMNQTIRTMGGKL